MRPGWGAYPAAIELDSAKSRTGGGLARLIDLPPRVALGFAAAVLCLAATVLVTVQLEAVRDGQARQVQQTTEALLTIEALEVSYRGAAASLDAQLRGQPGGDQTQVRRALDRLPPTVERVRRIAARDPEHRTQVEELAGELDGLVAGARAALADHAAGGAGRAAAFLRELGPARLARIEGLFAEMEATQAVLLEQRHARWRRLSVVGAVVFGVATLALLALILRAARLVRTEIRQRERLSAERAEMVELQKQLMAIVSHDLGNPLTAVKNTATLIAQAPAGRSNHREDAQRVVSNARRMERLIRDLLDFSRLRAGRELPLQPARADLAEVCRRIVSDLGRDAEERVTVEARGDPSGTFDADRLEQVASNLVTNALKYGPPESPVRVLVDGSGGALRLEVHDAGGELPRAHRQELFEPFQRGASGDPLEPRSAGLGLYIVRRIAEAHGGDVSVESEPAQGTTFTVRLPRPPAPAAAPPPAGG